LAGKLATIIPLDCDKHDAANHQVWESDGQWLAV